MGGGLVGWVLPPSGSEVTIYFFYSVQVVGDIDRAISVGDVNRASVGCRDPEARRNQTS